MLCSIPAVWFAPLVCVTVSVLVRFGLCFLLLYSDVAFRARHPLILVCARVARCQALGGRHSERRLLLSAPLPWFVQCCISGATSLGVVSDYKIRSARLVTVVVAFLLVFVIAGVSLLVLFGLFRVRRCGA